MTTGEKIVDAFRTRPDFLVLVIMQALTLYLIWQAIGLAAAQRQERELVLLHQCINQTNAVP
jgi:ABC-type methionine transport system permease subunit